MTDEREHRLREAGLDKTIEDSFPASDPPSTNPDPIDLDAARQDRPTVGESDVQTRAASIRASTSRVY